MGTPYVLAVIVLLATAEAANFTTRAGSSRNEPSLERFNYFDVELLQETCRQDKGNVVVSPASVKALMAMVLEGSGGQSTEQLQHALRIQEDKNFYRMQLNTFLNSLKVSNPGYVVELANRMFVSNQAEPRKEYQEALAKYYYSDVRQVDFTSPQITATSINDWVNDKTHGLINKLVEPDNISPYAKLLLVNAIYFKGRWKVPFDTDVTSVKNFYADDGLCQRAYYMEMLGSYHYAYIKELNAQALELPYEGNKFAMLLLMPNEVKGIHQLLRDLPYSPLQNVISKLVKTDVLVSVPRFKMDYSTDLVTSLSNLGIQDIFEPKANLSGMLENGESNYISNVFHKAKIEVNEEGSIAAAGTGAIAIPLMGTSFPKFHPNRPFLFFIRDLETGSILFGGRVALPDLANKTCAGPKPGQQQPNGQSQQVPNLQQPNGQSSQQVPNLQSPNGQPQQVPNHQQSNGWSQQVPSLQQHASGHLRPSFPSIIHNSGSETEPKIPQYSSALGNREQGQGLNPASYANISRPDNIRPLSGDKDAIQFY